MGLEKVLIIRFSSFGDINHCLFAAQALKDWNSDTEIHWLTRSDFADYLQNFPILDKVYSFDRKLGFLGLLRLGLQLRSQNYDLIYDAHNNPRTLILKIILFGFNKITRSKDRIRRFLFFKFRLKLFPQPFVAADSYLKPIENYIPILTEPSAPKLRLTAEPLDYTLLAPCATWPLKEWPVEKWIQLIGSTKEKYIVVGGPNDVWLQELQNKFPDRVQNLAGKLSWSESLKKVMQAKKIIGVDTGITHLGDLLSKPTVFLIGASAFGYPKRNTSHVAETTLWCKPCSKDGRGKCKNEVFKKCMYDINADQVSELSK